MLKCDFHLHTKEDPKDKHFINYTYKELFKCMAKQNYKFAPITLHNKVFFNKDVKYYAKKYGLITCSACEIIVGGKDILVFGITEEERRKIKNFDDLKDFFCIAAHPFYPSFFGRILGKDTYKYKHIFDAVEISSAHAPLLNHWNNKARKFAKQIDKPVVATSDSHYLWQLNKSYTFVETSDETSDGVFEAIRKKNIKPFQTKGSYLDLARYVLGDFKRP